MAIIGENIELGLSNQIRIRQTKLGEPTPSTDTIVYNNSKTSWLRVVSSVDVRSAKAAGINDLGNFKGNNLAKNLILMGPAIDAAGNLPNKVLSPSTSLFNQISSQYSIGGSTAKWGASPPPGVESVSIQALNRGAIRKGQIKIKAHNPDQFRLIETLYLRLGFTILVEWGHTMYFDNNGNLQNLNSFSTKPFNSFINGKGDFLSISEALVEERNLRDYNYDGFLGYVSNFNWNFNPDGSYSITLDVISRGGLIDSLTANKSGTNGEIPVDTSGTIIGDHLSYWYKTFKNATKQGNDAVVEFGDEIQSENDWFTPSYKFYYNTPDYDSTDLLKFDFESGAEKGGEIERFPMTENNYTINTSQGEESDFYYVSLGLLLRLLSQKGLVYQDDEKDGKRTPIVNIDSRYKNSWMLSHPYQQSVDPRICRLNNSIPPTSYTVTFPEFFGLDDLLIELPGAPTPSQLPHSLFKPGSSPASNNNDVTYNPFCGDIMGIMVNMSYILQVLNQNFDDEGNLGLKDFLQALLDGISTAIGSINKFNITYIEEENTVRIYDDNTIPGLGKDKTPTPIHVYDLAAKNSSNSSKGIGSFVKNLNFSSKIFPKIQNAVAIAAQNPDEPAGDQISSFQRLNRGIVDRIGKGAKDYYAYTGEGPKDPYTKYKNELYTLSSYFDTIYNQRKLTATEDKIEENKTLLKDILNYDLQWRVGEGQIESPYFIPVELSLELDGIAGFKLYEKFDITPDYILPPSYPNNVNFIIQGVSHDLSGGNWTTKLQTLSWPAENSRDFEFKGDVISGAPASLERGRVGGNQGGGNSGGGSESSTKFEDPTLEPKLVAGSSTLTTNFGVKAGTELTPAKAVKFLHPVARLKQQQFLHNLLKEPKLKGAKIVVTSTLRTFPQQDALYKNGTTTAPAGTSQHNYGCAFDINIYDQKTGKLVADNTSPGPNNTTKEIWTSLGIVDAAKKAGVTSWGGNFKSYFDPVHFGIRVNTNASLQTAKELAVKKGVNYKTLGVDDIFSLDITLA